MLNALLMSMLNRLADLSKQLLTFVQWHATAITVVRDRFATHQYHYKIRSPRIRRPAVVDPRNVRMVHNRQRLTFGFESCQCLARVHSQFDDLQSNSPTHRFRLLCHVDLAETAFTDLFEQLVATNRVTRLFPDPDRIRMLFRLLEPDGGVCQKCTAVLVSP